jgi:hypothetical protein
MTPGRMHDDINADDGPRVLEDGDEDLDLEADFYRRHPGAARRTDPLAARKQLTRRRHVRR